LACVLQTNRMLRILPLSELKDLSILQYKPVKSLAQYKSYESYLEKLLWIKEKSESEKESIQQLISLIGKWDADHLTTSSVIPKAPQRDPIEVLDGLMKANKINSSDLATTLGISQSGISDILNYRQELSDDLIAKLSQKFKVSLDVFSKAV
jgi:antitoxin component HigA of HigAB toxin-antitoxin module